MNWQIAGARFIHGTEKMLGFRASKSTPSLSRCSSRIRLPSLSASGPVGHRLISFPVVVRCAGSCEHPIRTEIMRRLYYYRVLGFGVRQN
ncbi:hypothetical protein HBI56_216010 [Parastagonospora nodorum]|uniref:Uncharacterized protein n=1 Tax=Phaeosphaeria nodorum (strain SN15 / ATCC MYA-4574 / FGSC 10173) TaxID=321614 RepID=A0A7U2F004_PHANO|nr:hypothetical protein HBH56_176450 [Parastagonospora nodorum]QRC96190.1 hypothetical protein JI435_408380 [Parastagonospora nodorum SN15]KAH3926295.1 hypothetical protein HBH54_166710 [Parastagonospora nodorum]KAH3939089.1 hypothetical protein HBH53_240210 [Parastagonospora nodorum]KAH3965539.1 hypothetical protein HBH52_203350 [Parastagonospora nodorum]